MSESPCFQQRCCTDVYEYSPVFEHVDAPVSAASMDHGVYASDTSPRSLGLHSKPITPASAKAAHPHPIMTRVQSDGVPVLRRRPSLRRRRRRPRRTVLTPRCSQNDLPAVAPSCTRQRTRTTFRLGSERRGRLLYTRRPCLTRRLLRLCSQPPSPLRRSEVP